MFVTNTGGVMLAGPFTVTDDKLGSFACGSSERAWRPAPPSLARRATRSRPSDLGDGDELADRGRREHQHRRRGWRCQRSTQDTAITGAGPVCPTASIPAWCIQDHVPTDLHNQPGKLYSTVGVSLPADVAVWPGTRSTTCSITRSAAPANRKLAFFKDVQTAVWVLLGEPNPEFGVSAAAQQMIDQANAQPDYVPGRMTPSPSSSTRTA